MAYRSAAVAGVRKMTAASARSNSNLIISKTLASSSSSAPKSIPASPFFSSSTTPNRYASFRIASVLASVESMMPLHSAIASARLQSNIAVDSACWSWLSQGLAIPL